MNPVSLVENSPDAHTNEAGEPLLLSGKAWRPELLMFCFNAKFLNDANDLLKPGVTAANTQR